MPRKVPTSHKHRREQLLLKRSIKRGDIDTPEVPVRGHRRTTRRPQPTSSKSDPHSRLQSSFIKLPTEFLDQTRVLSATLPLVRPIPLDAAILPEDYVTNADRVPEGPDSVPSTDDKDKLAPLTCPKRPKWRYDMSKTEVDANEQSLFTRWLAQTDETVRQWCTFDTTPPDPTGQGPANAADIPEELEPKTMPRAPTTFERNLEVWRQLWRVTEISHIILVLLDARCPLLHYPPSLATYLTSTPSAQHRRTILVLTKVDICGPARADAWTHYLSARFPDIRIVQVESYSRDAPPGDSPVSSTDQGKKATSPHLPQTFRQTLVAALRSAHAELLEPPEFLRSDAERLKWKPRVRQDVDWDRVLKAEGGQVGSVVGGAALPRRHAEGQEDDHHKEEDDVPEFLTIGLIGQPNVGKSSLLNALFGTYKVKASKAPGKTKHFQTLFWTPDVRLVDCPGLVMPNFVPMEVQVLSGILPISRVSAVPLCIHHSGQLLPLERVLALTHPALADAPTEPPPPDKRTWRNGMRPVSASAAKHEVERKTPPWTAMDILMAYATKKGLYTAKVGRPDITRAGNAILRALAEGRIRWAFWPPGTDLRIIQENEPEPSVGIWIPDSADGADLTEGEEQGDDADADEQVSDVDEDSWEEEVDDDEVADVEDDDDDEPVVAARTGATIGRFSALKLDEAEGDLEDEDE